MWKQHNEPTFLAAVLEDHSGDMDQMLWPSHSLNMIHYYAFIGHSEEVNLHTRPYTLKYQGTMVTYWDGMAQTLSRCLLTTFWHHTVLMNLLKKCQKLRDSNPLNCNSFQLNNTCWNTVWWFVWYMVYMIYGRYDIWWYGIVYKVLESLCIDICSDFSQNYLKLWLLGVAAEDIVSYTTCPIYYYVV